MTFDEWQNKHGPNAAAYDLEMIRAGWDGRGQQVDDLVMLVKRLAVHLNAACPGHGLPGQAMAYLKENRLEGSPMRETGN